jgi:hypothetical protein
MDNHTLAQLKVMKPKAVIILWYYGAPNSENLDDFMRLDASFSYSFNFSSAIKATLRGGVSISLMKTMSNRYYKVDPNDKSNTVVVNKSLGMTPNVSFRVNFNLK